MKKKIVNKKLKTFEDLKIIDLNPDGFGIAKINEKVVFIKNAIPEETVDIQIIKRKRKFLFGQVIQYKKKAEDRQEPPCKHFDICGGCKLQFLTYEKQLFYKQKTVVENLKRIGKILPEEIMPILPSPRDYRYRNKLEFTFSNKRWITQNEVDEGKEIIERNALGFHVSGRFDKVLNIDECYLQDTIVNDIRNAVRDFTLKNHMSYFDLIEQKGLLRNLIFRTTSTGELMLIFSFAQNDEINIQSILNFVLDKFPQINSLVYFINSKKNDTLYDLDFIIVKGDAYITEVLDGIKYRIGPKSFFQTNSYQVLNLYRKIKEFANFKGDELVFDLYTGTGSIALFIANAVKKVVGIESVAEAIDDAKENARINHIENTEFIVGDMKDIFSESFIEHYGHPDVVIIDPPRAGMHKNVVDNLLMAKPDKIIYVSCNSATQARDIEILNKDYRLQLIQPVDMFPQTHHVENIAILIKK